MAEILHHRLDVGNPINNGINYQPQLVQDFFHQQYHQWLRLKASLASLAAQQDGEASEDIAALVGAAEMQARLGLWTFFVGGNGLQHAP